VLADVELGCSTAVRSRSSFSCAYARRSVRRGEHGEERLERPAGPTRHAPLLAGAAGVVPSCAGSASRRARPDPRVEQRTSSKWVEFEDTPALGRFQWVVEIDPIDGTNEPGTAR
jgi:hypothetical protein